ncbi:Major Facilitator Superfamily protein [Streptomyces sp. LamerLS-31b]|nr:Major Facilitator Superfamily protein [Streptomyces sp. LamerLS-31b]
MFSLVRAPEAGWANPSALLGAALAVTLLAVFAVVERCARDPLVPVRLFAHRGLLAAMALTALYSATFSSLPYFMTIYFQNVRGYSAFTTGLAFLVPAVVTALGTKAGELAVTRLGLGRVLGGGMALGAGGAAVLGLALTGDGPYALLLPGIVLLGLGQGAAWTGMWIAAASEVAAEDQGVASGMASTTLQVGGAIGLALLVALSSGAGQGPPDESRLTGIRVAVFAVAAALCCGAPLALALRPSRTPAA